MIVCRDITKHVMYTICIALEFALGPSYEFAPLDRVEGGIECTMWPGKSKFSDTKSLRFPHKVPSISFDKNLRFTWKDNNDIYFSPKWSSRFANDNNAITWTYNLGGTDWTPSEKDIIQQVLRQINVVE